MPAIEAAGNRTTVSDGKGWGSGGRTGPNDDVLQNGPLQHGEKWAQGIGERCAHLDSVHKVRLRGPVSPATELRNRAFSERRSLGLGWTHGNRQRSFVFALDGFVCGVSGSGSGNVLNDEKPVEGQYVALQAHSWTHRNALSVMA